MQPAVMSETPEYCTNLARRGHLGLERLMRPRAHGGEAHGGPGDAGETALQHDHREGPDLQNSSSGHDMSTKATSLEEGEHRLELLREADATVIPSTTWPLRLTARARGAGRTAVARVARHLHPLLHEVTQHHGEQPHGGEGHAPALEAEDPHLRDRGGADGRGHAAHGHGEAGPAEGSAALVRGREVRDQGLRRGRQGGQANTVQQAQHEDPTSGSGPRNGLEAREMALHRGKPFENGRRRGKPIVFHYTYKIRRRK